MQIGAIIAIFLSTSCANASLQWGANQYFMFAEGKDAFIEKVFSVNLRQDYGKCHLYPSISTYLPSAAKEKHQSFEYCSDAVVLSYGDYSNVKKMEFDGGHFLLKSTAMRDDHASTLSLLKIERAYIDFDDDRLFIFNESGRYRSFCVSRATGNLTHLPENKLDKYIESLKPPAAESATTLQASQGRAKAADAGRLKATPDKP